LVNFAHALLFYSIRGETKVEQLKQLVEDKFCTEAEVDDVLVPSGWTTNKDYHENKTTESWR
jgi:hypothetical protein